MSEGKNGENKKGTKVSLYTVFGMNHPSEYKMDILFHAAAQVFARGNSLLLMKKIQCIYYIIS